MVVIKMIISFKKTQLVNVQVSQFSDNFWYRTLSITINSSHRYFYPWVTSLLNGTSSRCNYHLPVTFVIFLFHESKPSGPVINSLKWFCLKIRFREDICEISDSAPANTAQSRTLHRLTLRGVGNLSVCKSKIG